MRPWTLCVAVILAFAALCPAATISVKDHGAKGDGVTDDRKAVQAAIAAAPEGSTIYFPTGTYFMATGVRPEKRSHLIFTGDPGATIKAAGGKGGFLFAFHNCSDITITGLRFDLNGITHFGPGVSFHTGKRIRIHRNHFFDGNFQPKMTADRYAICFALGSEMSEDIWISENLIEHLQVEIDKARRVHVINNRSLAPELATGFGSFTLQKDVVVEDIEFVGNYVEDPQAYGINVAADGEREGAVLRRILIANNIVMCKKRAPMLAGIMVGSRDGKAVKGARWENVTIANNLVCYAAGVRKRHEESGIRVQVINEGEQISRVMITGNTVVDEAGIANWGIETRGLTDAVITGNAVYGTRGGLLGQRWTRTLAQGNRVSGVSGEGFCLKDSGGENVFTGNFVMGKAATPWAVSGLLPSDKVDTPPVAAAAAGAAPAAPAGAKTPPAAPAPAAAAPAKKSDVTGEMIRIANPDEPKAAPPAKKDK